MTRLSEAFARSPSTWILGALLVFSVWSHYRTGANFEQACAHAEAMLQAMPIDRVFADPDEQNRIDARCDSTPASRNSPVGAVRVTRMPKRAGDKNTWLSRW